MTTSAHPSPCPPIPSPPSPSHTDTHNPLPVPSALLHFPHPPSHFLNCPDTPSNARRSFSHPHLWVVQWKGPGTYSKITGTTPPSRLLSHPPCSLRLSRRVPTTFWHYLLFVVPPPSLLEWTICTVGRFFTCDLCLPKAWSECPAQGRRSRLQTWVEVLGSVPGWC